MKNSYFQNYILNAIAIDKAEELDWACIDAVRETHSDKALLKYYNNKVMRETGGDIKHHLSGLGLSIDFYNEDIQAHGYKSGKLTKRSSDAQREQFVTRWFAFIASEIYQLSLLHDAFSDLKPYKS